MPAPAEVLAIEFSDDDRTRAGQRLKFIRETLADESNLAAYAKKLGVPESTYAQWETGTRPREFPKEAKKIRDFLLHEHDVDVSLDFILFGGRCELRMYVTSDDVQLSFNGAGFTQEPVAVH